MTGATARTTTRCGSSTDDEEEESDDMAEFLHMLAFRPLVDKGRLSRDCAGDDDDSFRADPPASAAAALGLGRGGGGVRDARRRGRLPVRAGRADRAAARRVRVVARTDRLGGLAQPHALRADLALRR